ncbi:GDP-L-fucose synthase [uncultured archaeon]|nr:GDP-L-fucose synthase [uncultured archaeon]
MKTLLVTGGAGFLGYHLCNKLSTKFDKIIALDIDDFIKEEYPANVEFVHADIVNKELLEKIFNETKPDLVVHGAAALPLYSKKRIWEVNFKGSRNVLELCLKYKIKRMVFISSTAVYGVPEKHPLYEEDELVGVGPYGETKIAAEKLCEEFRKKGLCVPIIRPKTFIGVGRMGVFQILYDWIESGKRTPVVGNGKNRYQLLEVSDLVDAIELVLLRDIKLVNDTFNVGAKNFKTTYEDVNALCKYSKSGARVMKTPASFIKFSLRILEMLKLSPLYKWVYGTADKDSFVSIDKISKRFNWEPKYSNQEALIHSYQWYLDNESSLSKESGITHRVAWKQGFLGIIKKIL